MNLEIKNKHELIALHKIFMEAKYGSAEVDISLQGSPLVRDLYQRIFELLIEEEKKNPPRAIKKEPETWDNWRKLEGHSHRLEFLKSRLRLLDRNNWSKMDENTKKEYIECLVCPLIANSKEIKDLTDYADKNH